MALRAGYYGLKRRFKDKLESIAGSWDTTIASLFPRSEQDILGAKNYIHVIASSQTINEVVFTVYDDGSVKANGTATGGDAILRLVSNRQNQNDEVAIPNGTYYLSGSVGGSDTTYYMNIRHQGTGAIATQSNTQKLVTLDNTTGGTYGFNIIIKSGTQVEDQMFYPMLRLATDSDRTFVPYAQTNRDLTLSALDQKTTINAIIAAATGAADFAAFKTAMEAITPVTRSAAPDTRSVEEIEETPEEQPVKKTTRKKSTAKADTTEEV